MNKNWIDVSKATYNFQGEFNPANYGMWIRKLDNGDWLGIYFIDTFACHCNLDLRFSCDIYFMSKSIADQHKNMTENTVGSEENFIANCMNDDPSFSNAISIGYFGSDNPAICSVDGFNYAELLINDDALLQKELSNHRDFRY